MKQGTLLKVKRWVVSLLLTTLPFAMMAQNSRTVSGNVTDEQGEPLIGVTVMAVGSQQGAVTDFDGNYTINVGAGVKQLQFSYVGYEKQTVDISSSTHNIVMTGDNQLKEVVVIGYGVQKKTDLTGAISSVGEKDFNHGVITSAEQLVNGKISGVQITNSGGSPTAGATIRIRGGASLNASNDPLIVIDGVPMEIGQGITGSGNPLSLINPNDIETMTVLKDASSTAIYGSRASNGVILITTKKGLKGNKPKITFSTTNSLATVAKTVDMMSLSEMQQVVAKYGTARQKGVAGIPDSEEAQAWHDQVYAGAIGLGTATDWNDQIYRDAWGTDNNLSIAGTIGKHLPYRVSVGYMHQAGILKTDWSQRATAGINLSPSFFNDYLKFNINLKGTTNQNRFANQSAIWGGLTRNPYAPVYTSNDAFLGFHEAIDDAGVPITGATANPAGLLDYTLDKSSVKRFVGNIDVDYKFHFLPDLKLHMTGGYDYSNGKGTVYVPAEAFSGYTSGGSNYAYGPQKLQNRLFTVYLNYHKELEGTLPQTIDVMAGRDYQFWKMTSDTYNKYNVAGDVQSTIVTKPQEHCLQSYYGRLNYTLLNRYMLTATLRADGSSRFADGHKWGTFPSVAFAYNIAREGFFKPLENTINDLKLRVSYGVTGQQDGISNYGFMSTYTLSQLGASYQLGDKFLTSYAPSIYNADLVWETTKAFNVGVDLGFLNNRFTASIDYYYRKTKDLLANVPVAAGTNFGKEILSNVGNINSQGLELSFNANIISTKNWQWVLSGNATWQKVRIKNLRTNPLAPEVNTPQGWIESHYVQVLTENYAPYSFYVCKQIYDEKTGKPIEGLYADLDGDGVFDAAKDRYHYHSPAPDWIFGLSTSLTWKRLTLSASLRANVGNYVYNRLAMNTGAWGTVFYNDYQMNLMSRSYLDTQFTSRQYESDHYVENASFLKMDNISIGYNFGQISKYLSMNASFMVQNVFTITKYSGLDPEVNGGIDGQMYPRPRTYSLTLGFEF
ncbi:MAG: TonB-dependent receptor [Prevotella sp.]|nr:TonB-dependent receptor [Prevotella sp.]